MYDPNVPAPNEELTSAMFRSQFQGLKAIIDAIPAGPQGPTGPVGPPGEVTQVDLTNAIATTSANSNGVVNLSELADGSYNPSQMQAVINKLDELINALRR